MHEYLSNQSRQKKTMFFTKKRYKIFLSVAHIDIKFQFISQNILHLPWFAKQKPNNLDEKKYVFKKRIHTKRSITFLCKY